MAMQPDLISSQRARILLFHMAICVVTSHNAYHCVDESNKDIESHQQSATVWCVVFVQALARRLSRLQSLSFPCLVQSAFRRQNTCDRNELSLLRRASRRRRKRMNNVSDTTECSRSREEGPTKRAFTNDNNKYITSTASIEARRCFLLRQSGLISAQSGSSTLVDCWRLRFKSCSL